MITKLTAAQEAEFPRIVEKWVRLGLHPEYPTIETTSAIVRNVARNILRHDKELPILVLDSPIGVWMAVSLFSGRQSVRQSVVQSVEQSVEQSVRQSVRQSVVQSVVQSVEQSVWQSVVQSVVQSVWQSVWQLDGDFIWPYIDGHWYVHYFAWIEAMQYIGVTGFPETIHAYRDTAKIGLIYPLKYIIIAGRPPVRIHTDTNGALHKEDASAIAYADGWELFYLHGVSMKPEHVLTPAEQLDPKLALAESNVEVRRELIRKIGIERMLAALPHKVSDKSGNYELLSIDLTDELRGTRWLKMINPSVGCFHVEAVAPEINTVQEAINWRAGNVAENWKPTVLT